MTQKWPRRRQHLDGLIERNVTAGMSPEEARYAALRQFGAPLFDLTLADLSRKAKPARKRPRGKRR